VVTRHRTLATLMLGTTIVLGGRLTVGAVNASPTVSVVRLATFLNRNLRQRDDPAALRVQWPLCIPAPPA